MTIRAGGILRRIVVTIAVVYATYLIAGNALIVSGIAIGWVNDAQSNVVIEYDSAISIVPGHLWSDDLSITSKDTSVEMSLKFDHASVWISAFAAFDKIFRVDGYVNGAAIRIRNRRNVRELCQPGTRDIPTLPRLAAPLWAFDGDEGRCLAQAETAQADEPRSLPEELWHVDIDRVDIQELRELWIEDVRVACDISGTASFDVWPTSTLKIDPSTLIVHSATVGLGHDLTDGWALRGRIDVEMAEIGFGENDIERIISTASIAVSLESRLRDLGLLDTYLSEAEWLRFGESKGHLSVDARLIGGALAPGSRATLSGATIRARAMDHRAIGAGGAKLEVQRKGEGSELTARIDLGRYTVVPDGGSSPVATGRDLMLTLRARDPTVWKPLSAVAIDVSVPSLDIPDLTALNRTLGAEGWFAFEGGAASLQADLSIRRGDVIERGHLHLASARARARYADLALEAKLDLDMPLHEADLGSGHWILDGTRLSVKDALVRYRESGEVLNRGWWAAITLQRAKLDIDGQKPDGGPTFEARADGRMQSVGPLLAVFGARGTLPGFAREFDPGEANVTFEVGVSPVRVKIEDLHVDAGSFEARANHYTRGKTTDGGMLVELGPLTVGIEIENGKQNINVLGAANSYERNAKLRKARFP